MENCGIQNNYVLAGATMIRRFLSLLLLLAPSVPPCAAVPVLLAAASSSPHGSHARTTDDRRLSAKPPVIFANVLALKQGISASYDEVRNGFREPA